jgi:hypothetical protein
MLLLLEHIALAHFRGTAIIPGSAIVMKVFGDFVVSIVAQIILTNARSAFELNEKKNPDKKYSHS